MQRIHSLDLARGFTVLIMPAAHTLLLYGDSAVHQSLLATIFRFLAEGPGAQLFMLLMGVSFTFSKRISSRFVLQRAFYLLLGAYALNFLKFLVPLGLGILPASLLADFGLSDDLSAARFFFLIGDVLHLASISYLVLYVVSRLKHYAYISLVIAIAIVFISPVLWDVKTHIVFVDQLIILFNGHPPETFFPIFPWLTYPLLGLSIGYFLKSQNVDTILRRCGITGASLIIVSVALPATTTIRSFPSFYRTEPADTLFHAGFVLLWIYLFQWLSKRIQSNIFFLLLSFCSRQITTIYIIQWVLICWGTPVAGYLELPILQTVIWMFGMTAATLLLTYSISKTHVKQNL